MENEENVLKVGEVTPEVTPEATPEVVEEVIPEVVGESPSEVIMDAEVTEAPAAVEEGENI